MGFSCKPCGTNYFLALVVLAVTASAEPITFTFTARGRGELGTTVFSDALATVTATGDTSGVFELPTPKFHPDTFDIVPTQLSIDISGVGAADFTGTGFFGGHGYVFDDQSDSVAGFGIDQDFTDIHNSAFASYGLTTSLGAVTGVNLIIIQEATTLGDVIFTTDVPGNFSAQVGQVVPEPRMLLPLFVAFTVTILSSRRLGKSR
jgi:hypothetical protein